MDKLFESMLDSLKDIAFDVEDRDLNKEDIIKRGYDDYWSKYYTSNDYTKLPIEKFVSSTTRPPFHIFLTLGIIADYGNTLICDNILSFSDEECARVRHWDSRGMTCVYLSVVAYKLAKVLFSEADIKYYQGSYNYHVREDYPEWLPYHGNHIGPHAWITINDILFDCTFQAQTKYFLDYSSSYQCGSLPEGVSFYGFSEGEDIVDKYVEMFAKYEKISEGEWFHKHVDILRKHIGGILKQVDKQ